VASVSNHGPDAATGTVLLDEAPAGAELVHAAEGWLGRPCLVDPTSYICDLGDLGPGASTFVLVTVRVTEVMAYASEPTLLTSTSDPGPRPNSAVVTVDVVEPGNESGSDLVLTRVAAPAPTAGEPFTDWYLIENRGRRTLTGAVLQIEGGDGSNYRVLDARYGWFSSGCSTTATTTCTIAAVRAGEVQFVGVRAQADEVGAFNATASVRADQPDTDPTNDAVAVVGEAGG
jgi:hypothetical protein